MREDTRYINVWLLEEITCNDDEHPGRQKTYPAAAWALLPWLLAGSLLSKGTALGTKPPDPHKPAPVAEKPVEKASDKKEKLNG